MIPEGEVVFIIDKLHFPQYKTANWNLAKLQPTNVPGNLRLTEGKTVNHFPCIPRMNSFLRHTIQGPTS